MKFKLYLAIFVLVFATHSLFAQSGSKKSKEAYDFREHLWYGMNIGGIGLSSNTFSFGLAPMGGYKFNDNIALGVITKFNYTYFWQQFGDNFNFFDYGIGGLAKIKFFRGRYFVQTEYDLMSIADWNGIETVRKSYPFFYVGGGMSYPGNGRWTSEVSILYNLHPDSNNRFFPLTINYGFLYNF